MFLYAIRGIWHYRRINVVVMLAVAISTAVIGGSLIVGDSVRFSLRTMTEQRLGRISDVLTSHRFFRQQLAADLQSELSQNNAATDERRLAPAILLTGSVEHTVDETSIRRAGSVTLLGVDDNAWSMLEANGIAAPTERNVVLGYRTAQELNVDVGADVSLWLEVPASIPRDSLMGEREETTVELVLTVSAVVPEDIGASRFALNPGQQLPYNAFLPLATLQERLGLEEVKTSRRNPVASPARVNTILLAGPVDTLNEDASADDSYAAKLTQALPRHLKLEDAGLKIRTVADRGYLSVETDRMILDAAVSDAAEKAAEQLALQSEPTVVYLSNEIFATDRDDENQRYSMYSIIAGIPLDSTAPLGPLKPDSQPHLQNLESDEIILSAWLAQDLDVTVGDSVSTKWHEVGSHGELPEIESTFTVRGILPDDDPLTVDENLTPYVKGVTDVESFDEVDQPFEMKMDRLTERDDEYWDLRRATPKAFVSYATAKALWSSRYGTNTSIRISSSTSGDQLSAAQLKALSERLEFEVPRQLNPESLGMVFRPVLAEGLAAAVGANDFTQLFIGFSFFLILSAIILASLMFRLGIQQRIRQLGLLNAIGWPEPRVRKLFLTEGLLICVSGTVVGVIGGVLFAQLMIYGLTTWWVGAVGTQFLLLDIQPNKLAIAAIVSLGLAGTIIRQALRSFKGLDIRTQLAGDSSAADTGASAPKSGLGTRVRSTVGFGSIVTAVVIPMAVIARIIPKGEAFGGLSWQMVCFFLAGFACLTAGLFLLSEGLRRRSQSDTIRTTIRGIRSLALANAARSPARSMLTTALISFAAFVIVAVGAGHRNPLSEIPDFDSGNGGFSLVAESAQPVIYDINTADGQSRIGFDAAKLPDDTHVYSFSMKPGSDASCVNLYQTRVPTLLGASDRFLERGGFRFADTPGDNPWATLSEPLPDYEPGIPVIPVIGDMNTLMYSLKKPIGSQIMVPNEQAPEYVLEVVGMLDGSVFQGVLVMSDINLKRVEVETTGARYFLVETNPEEDISATASVLETQLNSYGFDAESVSERLAGFLAVQNTYLSTFQMLGGLGLLVGTFGLAAVMMRNVVERRQEIALLRAVGFTRFRVTRLILSENSMLLIWGILLGAGAALLAMLPHLQSTGADLPWRNLTATLAAVAVIGSLASVFAIRAAGALSIRENLAAE